MQIRQGDVLVSKLKLKSLPAGAVEVPLDRGRVVLAYGEVTGHAHAIRVTDESARADEMTDALIERCKLYADGGGKRFLVVSAPVSLGHEEHTAHTLMPGIYAVPVQVAFDAGMVRRVED